MEDIIIKLPVQDGSEINCIVLSVFEHDNKSYIVLVPTNNKNEEELQVLLYRCKFDEDEMITIMDIESDEEFYNIEKLFRESIRKEVVNE